MRTLLFLGACVLTTTACGREPAPPADWTRLDTAALTATQQAQQVRGLAAKDAVFIQLTRSLKAAFEQGEERVVDACRVVAPRVADEVGTAQGLRIGRTSFKLRNPKNAAPTWATGYVADRAEQPVWLAHRDGRLAGLLPIRTKAMCLTCHGEEAEIPAPIRTSLRELYPEDEAIGFTRGGLRGWFWLEIPAP